MNVSLVEVFADAPFTGNPAAVVLLDETGDPAWMQQVAAELNQPATAFLYEDRLRWFSRAAELDFCGHGTAGTAHVLFERGAASDRLTFSTAYGELAAERIEGGVELDLPASPTIAEAVEGSDRLGLAVVATGRTPLDVIVEVASAAEVREYEPDFDAILGIETRSVIVTAPGDDGHHAVVSRVFVPSLGIPEDPATGSAHSALATWWAPRVGTSFLARQASARGATIRVRLDGDRVRLGGPCRIVLEGELT
jgi:predicted PhzF superfamily epimerase YddE/YHI9